MKINKPSTRKLRKQLKKWKEADSSSGASTAGETGDEDFSGKVSRRKIELLDMEMSDLVDELGNRGKTLINHPTMAHVHQYQQALATFLKTTLQYSREVERKIGRRHIEDLRQGNDRKEHVIVNTIDEKMDRLMQMVKNRERTPMNISEAVGELQGLVVDLVNTLTGDEKFDGSVPHGADDEET